MYSYYKGTTKVFNIVKLKKHFNICALIGSNGKPTTVTKEVPNEVELDDDAIEEEE